MRRLWLRGLLICFLLSAIVLALLSFADSFAEPVKSCAPNFMRAKLPMWIGCALAVHEDLSAGLIGGAGALFAAWLAFTAISKLVRKK
jgi:hypothetical protein